MKITDAVKNFIIKLLEKLPTTLYESEDGLWSTTRFLTMFVGILSTLSIYIVWIVLSSIKGELLSIPESVIVLYTSSLIILITGKYKQKIKEIDLEKIIHGNKEEK